MERIEGDVAFECLLSRLDGYGSDLDRQEDLVDVEEPGRENKEDNGQSNADLFGKRGDVGFHKSNNKITDSLELFKPCLGVVEKGRSMWYYISHGLSRTACR